MMEILVKLAIHSDSVTKEGSIYEGNFFIQLRERFKEQHPRLILRWHRASSVYKKIKNYRTSSERSNSTSKENDLDILERPRVRGIKRAVVLSYLSDIASFLKRVFGLIIRVTVNLRKYRETKNKKYWERLFGSKLPLYLLYVIQRE